jgi:hypothetical protein
MTRDHHALADYLAAAADRPFEWGTNDCVVFAADAVRAQTGADPLKGLPNWRSKVGAARALKALGGLEAAVDGVLTPVAPALARRGDISLVRQADQSLALMVVEGETLAGPGANGVRRAPRSAMMKAWCAA